MAKKLYVGGLSYGTTEQALTAEFSKAGKVASASIIMDRETGNSKGFGFVEMESDSDAENAISMFDGAEFDGRKLTVNEARPKTDRPKSDWGGNRGGGGGGSWSNNDRSRNDSRRRY
jgi:cold-inducible RNA-binding protein